MSDLVVMLVDDAYLDLYINTRIIKKCDASTVVKTFDSAVNALNDLQSNKSHKDQIPDIIFLDLNMPVMTGFQFLDEFKTLSAELPSGTNIYVLSSSFDPADISRSKDSEFVVDFIEKPLTENQYLQIANDIKKQKEISKQT